MQHHKYQSEFARKYYGLSHERGREEGREEGRLEGLVRAALGLAAAKLSSLPPGVENQIRAIRDLDALARLIVALGQALSEPEARAVLEATTNQYHA